MRLSLSLLVTLGFAASQVLASDQPSNVVAQSDMSKQKCHMHPTIKPSSMHPSRHESLTRKVGYFFFYFKDDTEQVNAGLSIGNDPLNYTLYNGGDTPILTSQVGSNHTRDPYLVQAYDRSKNWIIATDNSLRDPSIDATRNASRSITIYESEGASLTKWKPARLSPPLAGPWSGGVAAPEAHWDVTVQQYMVTFGSNRFQDQDTDHTGTPAPSSIYYCYAKDFVNFTQPQVYFAIPNGGASDLTIAALKYDLKTYVRFFRDDTNATLKVRGQISTGGFLGNWTDIGQGANTTDQYVSPDQANGGPLVFRDNQDSKLFHIWIDEFTGGYLPFESDKLSYNATYHLSQAPSFPKDLKQGCVVPVNSEEYNELRNATFST